MKVTGCRFDSSTHARRRVIVDGARLSGAGQGGGGSGVVRGRG
jgi:hypothetical protein